jgi:hypothetical protein
MFIKKRKNHLNHAQKTFGSIRLFLKETNKDRKESFKNDLHQRIISDPDSDWLDKFRFRLFDDSNTFFLVITCVAGLIFLGLFGVKSLTEDLAYKNHIRSIAVVIASIPYFGVPFFLEKITPKVEFSYEILWSNVVSKYLHYENLNGKLYEAKIRLKRARQYYIDQGRPLKFMIQLLWGGIIIGCLPDKEFQEVLITLDPLVICKENPLGGLSLISLPFILVRYHIKYDLPIAWLENTLAQIELHEESTNH